MTKNIIRSLLIAASVLFLALPTQAQQYGPVAGDWELTLGGGGSNDRDFDNGSFNLNTGVGYYFTPAMELGLRQGLNYADFGESVWNGSTRLAFDYHFDLDRFRPFLGVNVGGVYGESVRNTFAAGFEGGLKYYVQERTFVFGMLEYQWLFRSAGRADNNFDDGQFLYTVGIGFNF
jgi:hypothetical protein